MRLLFDIIAWIKDILSPRWVGDLRKLPSFVYAIPLAAIPLTWVPLAAVFWYRSVDTRKEPRLHMFLDMDNQPKLKTQRDQGRTSPAGYSMTSLKNVPGTVARGELKLDDHFYRGYTLDAEGNKVEVTTYPARVLDEDGKLTEAFLERGRLKYNIYCSICHGDSGNGIGAAHMRAGVELESLTWAVPQSLLDPSIVKKSVGSYYDTITNGSASGNMKPYRWQVKEYDRWAIIAYMRALQLAEYPRLDPVDQPVEE